MTLTRILTAIPLIGITLVAIYKGGLFFTGLITLCAILCLNEILTIKKHKHPLLKASFFIIIICLMASTHSSQYTALIWKSKTIIAAVTALIAISSIELIQKKPFFTTSKILSPTLSLWLVGLTFPFAILIRQQSNGLIDALFLLTIITCVDSCSYFIGKKIGKTQLTVISPKKTIEGSIGGIFCGISVGTIIALAANLDLSVYIPLSVLICLTSPLGDIHESLIKRYHKIKDSSTLLPGHGGIYDRLDGYLFSFPLFFYTKLFLETLL